MVKMSLPYDGLRKRDTMVYVFLVLFYLATMAVISFWVGRNLR